MANGVNIAVFGPAGTGKTRLCATTPNLDKTLILSVERESGLLSLREYDIPTVRISSTDQLLEVFGMLQENEAGWEWVCLDSVSEIAGMILEEEQQKPENLTKGGEVNMMWVYGALKKRLIKMLTAFKMLPINTYFTFECDAHQVSDNSPVKLRASVPGGSKDKLSHIFDIVAFARVDTDEKGVPFWSLQCHPDGVVEVKDRTGCLDRFEKPDLTNIYNKIHNNK